MFFGGRSFGQCKDYFAYRKEQLPFSVIVIMIIVIIIIMIISVGSARLRESDIHPMSPKTPAPQYRPLDRKTRK